MSDEPSVYDALPADMWGEMYLASVKRIEHLVDDVIKAAATGLVCEGTEPQENRAAAMLRVVVAYCDGMDVLGAMDLEPLKAAWVAVTGSMQDFPVVTLILDAPGREVPDAG